VAFRPIDIKMGPDGAIYIADWYNPIIQHGEVDFRDPRRDHTRGRIWRVTAKGRPLVRRPDLVGVDTRTLLDALESPEQWTRQQARRVLQERGGDEVLTGLSAWVAGLGHRGPEAEHHRLEALWTFEALGRPAPELLRALLNSPDARVRAAAVRVVSHWKDRLGDPESLLGERVADAHPRVRLEALRALAEFPSRHSADLALSVLDRPVDPFLDYGVWLTARQLAPQWLPAVRSGRFDFGGRPARLVYALLAVGTPEVVEPLLALLREGKVPPEQDGRVQDLVATLGGPDELAAVLELVLEGRSLDEPRRVALLELLARAAERRKVIPAGDLSRVVPLLTSRDDAMRAAAVRAAGAWNIPAIQGRLAELAGAEDTPTAVRAAAVEAMARQGKAEGRRAIEALADRGASAEIQAIALAALEEVDPNAAAPRIAAWLGKLPVDRANAAARVLAGVVERRGGPASLTKALGQGPASLPPDLAKLYIRQVRARGRDEPGLVAALSKAGRLDSAPKGLSAPEMTRLLADVARVGDPARGEQVFRRKDLTCQKCHAIAGAGGQVGPGLESIGASAQPDYLVDSILQPNKQVKENYHAVAVATNDGRIYTGIKVRQTDGELVLRDTEDREVSIPLSAIEDQKTAGSIMPAGLADGLTRSELVDLVRFLSELGKVGRYAVGTRRVCRRWQVLEPTPEAIGALARGGPEGVLGDGRKLTWRPAYSTVAGLLPPPEWAAETARGASPKPAPTPSAPTRPSTIGMARTQVQVTTGGKIRLSLESTEGLSYYLDGRRVEPSRDKDGSAALSLDVSPGVHTLAVAICDNRREGIRWILEDVPGSPARAQVVLGK
jgi:putative heme-binding domain-containing protein